MLKTHTLNSTLFSCIRLRVGALLSVFFILSLRGSIQATPLHWLHHTPEKSWLHHYDPTLISPRLHSELSYKELDDGLSKLKLETSFRWATSIKENHAFGIQAMLPFVLDHSDTEDNTYFDNIELRTGFSGRITECLRYGIALNATLDTVNHSYDPYSPSLELRPIIALRWDYSDSINLGIQGEYSFTPYDENENDLSEFELKLSLAAKLSKHWSGAVTYKPKWDFVDNSNRHRLSASTTRSLGANHQYGLTFGVEVPLSKQDLEYKLSTSLSWYF